ncbi:MAG: 50S ribosomal protein L29 [Acidiferrobacteraceae bacterium]|jgi:large subunit ribosomal protein L29
MNIEEMRAATPEARNKELEDLLRQQFTLRLRKATGQLASTAELPRLRREVARLKTVINEARRRS